VKTQLKVNKLRKNNKGVRNMDDRIYNYCALYEVIFCHEEILPDAILRKYGLIQLSDKELKRLEGLEMRRLKKENMTLNEIGRRFNMSDSGVFRRIKKIGDLENDFISKD